MGSSPACGRRQGWRSGLSAAIGIIAVALLAAAPCGAAVQEASAASPDQVVSDHWYAGVLNGQTAASMHEVVLGHPDGSRTTTATMTMVIVRSLGSGDAARSVRLSVAEVEAYDEDHLGNLVGFRFDHDESGQSASAQGVIVRDATGHPLRVHGTLVHLGHALDVDLPLNPQAQLLSDRQLQERMAAAALAVNEQIASDCVYLMDDRLRIGHTVATYLGPGAHARRTFTENTDLVGIPIRLVIDAKGELVKLSMDLGVFSIAFAPAPGPVALAGGEIGVGGLITARGPAPGTGSLNHYRLPSTAHIDTDEFQTRQGDILTVTSYAAPSPAPPASFLAPEAKLELDDPELRQWVAQALAGTPPRSAAAAERLRMAVRSYLTGDLGSNNLSAVEAFRAKRGDCTCHAALLCAALRISGIPARIDIGVVWDPELGSWAGHAWNSAYVEGRWQHLDSAYPGHPRSTYLKLAAGSGEQGGASPLAAMATLSGTTVETLPAEPAPR